MNISKACGNIIDQLIDVVGQIKEQDFGKPIDALSQSTIGQHLRHTIEFFICLQHGFEEGVVNYDKRKHDRLLETDKYLALSVLTKIKDFVYSKVDNKSLMLEVGYDVSREEFISLDTTFMRELVYNIEHAVHHMALIKIGVREAAAYVELPSDFGIAASTIRYKDSVPSSH